MRNKGKSLLCVVAAMSILLPASPATAAENASASTQAETEAAVTFADSYLEKYGVKGETKAALLDKIRAGEMLDSESSREVPMSLDTVETETLRTTITSFPDGSVSVTEMELPKEELRDLDPATVSTQAASARNVGACTSTSTGSGYASYIDCAVSGSNTNSLTVAFRASYSVSPGGYGSISEVYGGYQACTGCTASEPTLVIQSGTATPGNPAVAYATGDWTRNSTTSSYILYLRVGNGASTEFQS